MNFLHTYNPEPIAFSVGFLDVYWYGLIIAGAVLAGLIITFRLAKKRQVDVNHVYNLLFLIIIFGLIGGRIGHIISEWQFYQDSLSMIIKIWDGGLAIHGVMIASALAVLLYSRIKKVSFWTFSDLIVVTLPLMQSIGRWGNYFNQEIFGEPTDVAWGIPIDIAKRPSEFIQYQYFHPVFLYESILMLLVFFLMLYFFQKNKFKAGQLTLLYFAIFAVIRFSLDFLKIDMPALGPLLLTQWISILLFMGAVCIWIKLVRRKTSF